MRAGVCGYIVVSSALAEVEPMGSEGKTIEHGAGGPAAESPVPGAPDPAGVEPDIFRDYGRSLRLYFRQRLSNPDDAEDALQDTHVRLLRYRDNGLAHSPQALVFRVAESVLRDRHRRQVARQAERHVELHAVEIADPLADQEYGASIEQELALLSQAIGELTPKCRRVFLLSRLHHLTYPEIAAQLGLSVQMVAKYISTALAACRRKLGEDARGGRQ